MTFRRETFALGSYVQLKNPDDDEQPYIAKIVKLINYPDEGPATLSLVFDHF